VLSIRPIGSTRDEVTYYAELGRAEHHEYYSEDGHRPGIWWGEGAKVLGLVGEVNPEEFANLLKGLAPDGSRALVQLQNNSERKRRAGFDLTFSEVKSFSAAWSQASPEQRAALERVAERALYRTLDVVQELCGVTRRGRQGTRQETAKLVGAVFHHDTARPIPGEVPDPNVHHHVVLANVVMREHGTSGALDARPLFRRRMKMAIGALFRAELAMLLESELGISTYRPQKEHNAELVSWFELAGVPKSLTHAMSKRRTQIEKWLRQHGMTGAKASEKATLSTRHGKERFTWEELTTSWQALGREHGFTSQQVEAMFGKTNEVAIDRQAAGKQAAKRALTSLVKQKARFSEIELLERTAVEAQTQGVGIDEILTSVQQLIEHEGELVQLKDLQGVRAFTTRGMLELEKRLLSTAQSLHRRTSHAIPKAVVERAIMRHPTLRPDQARAVRAIATGGDLAVVTGVAGSGKTFMLSVARGILEAKGLKLLGTALASKAAKGLEIESGIQSTHIHKLLLDIERERIKLDPLTVLVVDEAGMVGTVQMERLVSLAKVSGAHLVLVVDHLQLQAISAGAPLRKLGETIGTTEMTTIVRQRQGWHREMVLQLRAGEAEKALVELFDRGQLKIESDREEAMERLVSDWAELVFEQGEDISETLVLAGMNADVRELNRRLQDELIARQQLGEYSFQLGGLDFYLGDRVMVTKNQPLLNLRNGTTAEVVGIDEKRMWLLTEDGIEVGINTKEFSDITLAYALSVHKSQGVTCDSALILTGDAMTDREFAYVAGSRPRERTVMYTDSVSVGDLETLAARMSVSRQKEMAMEHLLELA